MSPSRARLDKSSGAIRDMFAGVAPRYDFLNHLLSGALDVSWRRKSAASLELVEDARVLDLCCGTGDQALAVRKRGGKVIAGDFCLPMLALAERKYSRHANRRPLGLAADALGLPFGAHRFDAATVSFGLRNVADLDAALAELRRVLRRRGRIAILEFAVPEAPWLEKPYLFYFERILPRLGRLVSPRGSAYSYLPSSVLDFPQRGGFLRRMQDAGFRETRYRDLTGGTVCLYSGDRGMTEILDGAALAKIIRSEVAQGVTRLVARGARPPGLAAVLVGEDPASKIYVGSKARAAEAAGFTHRTLRLDADTSQKQLEETIDELNRDDAVDGILIQLPLPASLRPRSILDRLDPAKDVDGLHAVNVGRLWLGQPGLFPATPSGIVALLERSGLEIEGKRAVIVGRSPLVGKPLAGLLLERQATVTICHSRTRDLQRATREADLLVAAVGKLAMIGPDFVKEGAVVIDVGIHRITDASQFERLFPGNAARRAVFERKGGVVAGDVDFDRVAPRCAAITPVPGGVGPLTVAMLLANTLTASRRRQGEGGR